MGPSNDVTQLLTELSNGNQSVMDELMSLVYAELHKLADRYLRRERPDHTLQPTALVHEAFLRLVDQRNVRWQNRAHFFGVAAKMMRRILVDHARGHHAIKRDVRQKIPFDEAHPVSTEPEFSVVALDDALNSLELIDPQKSLIVELRFFGGLSVDEVSEVLGVSSRTVLRQWRVAKAWLYREIKRN